ncbi:hypothetical protein [Athalassotoga sp.]|uniref:hypothetical protein n=1 Tax=Athalassotoga sp. TaxID=2022597 RepID=UPI003CFCE973
MKYPIIFRTSLAIALGLLAVLIPFLPLKIIFGVSALIIFAINMRRYAAFLIVISVIFAVVVAIRVAVPYDVSSNFNFFPSIAPSQTLYPDKYIQGAGYLSVNVTGLDMTFDPSTSTIYIPSSLKITRSGNTLDISSQGQNNATFRIVVGTKDKFVDASFHTTGLKVNGNISGEEITFNSVGIDMNSSISARTLSINGVGINLNGTLNASSVEINGTGDKIDLMVSANTMKINGVSVDGNLKYTDEWTGSRSLFVNAIGGNLSVYTVTSNQGSLDIQNTGGFLKINRIRY